MLSDGTAAAIPLACPHLGLPLDAEPDATGIVTCPWHGYRFDVRTGASADDRGLRLAPAPSVAIEGGRVVLRPAT